MLEFNIKPIMMMLDLLTKSWLWQQLLMTWCVPNNHQWSFTQTPTIQCLPPRVVMQLQRRELKFKVRQPLSCTQTPDKETKGNTRPDLTTLSQSYGHTVGESTMIVNKGNYPAKRVCITVIHGLSQISYD